jgi:uncharacterized protein YjiS (DUF1127 family)
MFKPIIRKWINWYRRHEAVQRLTAMDSRMLADLGAERATIASFVADRADDL